MSYVLGFIVAAISAMLLTGLLRRYALSNNLLDVPNKRSSHDTPTPRGGGLSIVLVFLTGLWILNGINPFSDSLLFALLGAGAWIAFIGFMDDHRHIPAQWRLLAHFLGAVWVLYWIDGLPPLQIFGIGMLTEWVGHVLMALYLVWLLNLYNFMDGIDGIAGIEGITVCLGGMILFAIAPLGGGEWMPIALLMAATCGFLYWNIPKARIFMGDVGSGFMGMVIGVFSLYSGSIVPELFWSWLILLGAFIVDATVTISRRIWQKEKFYEAHRSHAYQHASREYGSHLLVAFAVGVINIIWLLPLAVLVALDRLNAIIGLLIAYLPLVWVALRFKAGKR